MLDINKERLDISTNDVSLGFWEWNLKADRFVYNRGFARLAGIREAIGESGINLFFDRLHPKDRPALRMSILLLSDSSPNNDQFAGRYRITEPNGDWRWTQIAGHVSSGNDGQLTRVAGTLMDIDAHNETANELNNLRESHQLILDSVNDGILGLDFYGRLTFVNRAAERMLGRAPSELIGTTLEDHLYQRRPQVVAESADHCPIYRYCSSGQACHHESGALRHENGSPVPVEISCMPIQDERANRTGTIVVLRDLSKQKNSDDERERLEQLLQHAQKMETVGQLTGGIAHDFNNFLGSILGFVNLAKVQMDSTVNPDLQRCLNEIELAGERARDLIAKLMVFSRCRKRDPEHTLMTRIVDDSCRLLGPVIPASIALSTDYEPGTETVSIHADPTHIQQIVMNLCINARDALENGGSIRIGLKIVQAKSQRCSTCESTMDGEFLELTIRDNGCGFANTQMQEIFDPFYTTKPPGKGTGMGLAVVNELIHQSNDHICVETVLGKGSVFRVLFAEFDLGKIGA